MLTHSPPLPLIINYFDEIVSTEDEEGILLALQHRDRVRSICLVMHVRDLQNPTTAMDDEFTSQAPPLCHLLLMNFVFLRSPLLTTAPAVNLFSLSLGDILRSVNFHLNDLLQSLLHTPQLETLNSFPLSCSPSRRSESSSSASSPFPYHTFCKFSAQWRISGSAVPL